MVNSKIRNIVFILSLTIAIVLLSGCVVTHRNYETVRATVTEKFVGCESSGKVSRTTDNVTVEYDGHSKTVDNSYLYRKVEVGDKINCTLEYIYDGNNKLISTYLMVD